MSYPINFSGDLNLYNFPDQVLAARITEGTHRYHSYQTYPYEGGVPDQFPATWNLLLDSRGTDEDDPSFRFFFEAKGAYLIVQWSEGENLAARVVGNTSGFAKKALDEVREVFPRAAEPPPDRIPVKFWAWHEQRGPVAYRRQIVVPSWTEISPNYPTPVRDSLHTLMTSAINPEGGQLMLLTGEPGTGKTYALRALGREWREWAQLEYITDPGPFFSGPASYLISCLLDAQADSYFPTPSARKEAKWRVLVLEDAGEFLAMDAKAQTRDGISRLLNVVDGLIGQGLRVMVLATTNEELGKLHPAISRPGRCSFNLKFVPFSPDEANVWRGANELPEQNGPGSDRAKKTLAQLYAEKRGEEEMEKVVQATGAGFRV